MYALNLDTDGRILSVTYDEFATDDMPRAETIPDGNVADYKYINNEYVYDPLPEPESEQVEPSIEDRIAQTEADIEFIAMMTGVDMEV